MRALVLSFSAFAAVLAGFSVSGVARADSSDLMRLVPANALYRALVSDSSRTDFEPAESDDEDWAETEPEVAATPPLPELPELPEQPEALPTDPTTDESDDLSDDTDGPMPVEADMPPAEEPETTEQQPVEEAGGFKYDDELLTLGLDELPLVDLRAESPTELPAPLDEMIEAAEETPMIEEPLDESPAPAEPMIEEPAAPEPEEVAPLPRLPLPADPFFGSINAMLGATGPQPWITADAVRPPTSARFFDGKWVNLDPWGKPTLSVDELSVFASGESLNFNTRNAGDAEGRAVLLVDGRALRLKTLEWTDTRVNLDLPELKLARPTIARVYIADANGKVVDFADFLLE